ncbi:ClC family H(+)/Cl(-) exchange transporter [Olsenella uli]|uniref:ClC family H(+)/Cl(-) exchange transporter n=1 Tax=Olsenella uli TaxID=133926 RepID=UPI0019574FEA|nr:ClC family H(+)/Cl(-) exchange transporter [Olsenella uli]MBM6817017.1 ClC family H(+)/Cl(-) exchange transporter [Olsenella uli]
MEDLPQHEIVRRLSRRFQVALVLEGLLVGLVAGGVITLYRLVLSNAERLLRLVTGAAAGSPLLMAAWFAVLAVLLACVSALVTWEPATSGSGIPQIDAEVVDRMDAPWRRVIPAKFAEGAMLALAGLSLGREGPSVQLGGMSGKAVSRALRRRRGEERLLVTCGAAAGMSAAFHAPLTGVLFALEEIHKEFTAPLIISVMCSSVASDYLVSQALGVAPVMSVALGGDLPHASYGLVVLLGLVAGLLGALHNRGMFACQGLFGRLPARAPLARLAVPFALAGVMAFAWPELLCGGDAIIELLESPEGLGAAAIAALLLGKYLYTTVCFGSGAPGGTLLPLVVMGALVGGLFARGMGALGMPGEYVPNFVALGVAGLFSGVVRAPVTAVVLVFELTGSLDALLSASVVSVVAYVTANLTETEPFYEHLLAALLGSQEKAAGAPAGPAAGGKSLQTVLVGAGSRLEGMLVRDVPWPDGMRVVTIERAGGDVVPSGGTRIEALDRLLVIVDASATDDALLKLRLMSSQRVR